jgi:NADH/NAD ratio-sensing transcriptional regulator Rex
VTLIIERSVETAIVQVDSHCSRQHADSAKPTAKGQRFRAILSVPASAAQEAAEQLVKAGVRAILNFTPTVLRLPKSVTVNNVNLASELENLSYFGR